MDMVNFDDDVDMDEMKGDPTLGLVVFVPMICCCPLLCAVICVLTLTLTLTLAFSCNFNSVYT